LALALFDAMTHVRQGIIDVTQAAVIMSGLSPPHAAPSTTASNMPGPSQPQTVAQPPRSQESEEGQEPRGAPLDAFETISGGPTCAHIQSSSHNDDGEYPGIAVCKACGQWYMCQ
jgi:hypothetical protein